MKKYLVLECVRETGIVNRGPTVQKTTEFRICIVGAENHQQAIDWAKDHPGWTNSVVLRHKGFDAFDYKGALSVVYHASNIEADLHIVNERLRAVQNDSFVDIIEQIPMYLFEDIVGKAGGVVLREATKFAEPALI